MATNARTARNNIRAVGTRMSNLQGGVSGQVAGTVGTTILLSEFFTFDDDTQTFELDFIEKVRSGISNAIQNLTGLDKEQADLGAKITTFIVGAVSSFVVVSTIAGAIAAGLLAALSSPIVLGAALVALTIYLATSESELADQLRGLVAGAIEGLINLPVNLITGSEGTVQDRQSDALRREEEAGNPLDSAMIAARTNTTFRGMTEEEIQGMISTWETESEDLMSRGALSRLWNSPVINTYQTAIERAEAKLLRMADAAEKAGTALPAAGGTNAQGLPTGGLPLNLTTTNAFASGGYISGPGTATSDSIPAMLSDGEFVMKASAVQKFGAGFMAKINAGIMPQFFSEGGSPSVNEAALQRLYDEQASDTARLSRLGSDRNGMSDGDRFVYTALQTNIAERAADIAELEAQNARASAPDTSTPDVSPTTGGDNDGDKSEGRKSAEDFAKGFKDDFKSGLSEFLHTGDLKGFLTGLLDSFTSNIINSFVEGFTENLFEKATGEGGWLSNLFKGGLSFGESVATNTSTAVSQSLAAQEGQGGFLSSITGFFGKMFEGIKGIFSGGSAGGGGGLLSGLFGGGGGGGLFSSLFGMSFGGFLGFSQGGIVPNTPTSQIGKDSVPTMLMPGEVVLSKSDVGRMGGGSSQPQQTVINLGITGNVDRETRRNIVKMLSDGSIANGVNNFNKERGAR